MRGRAVRSMTITACRWCDAAGLHERRKRPPLQGGLSHRLSTRLPGDPAAAAPVAVTFMLAERKSLPRSPVPIVLVNHDPRFRREVGFGRVPADSALADDGG